MTGFRYEKDADNIVTVTMDMPGQSANTMSDAYDGFMGKAIEALEVESDLAGVVFASAKNTFFAGADLNSILTAGESVEDFFKHIENSRFPSSPRSTVRRSAAGTSSALPAITGLSLITPRPSSACRK